MRLYSVSRNTVSNWIRAGLHPSACGTPQLFHGAELSRFHIARRVRRTLQSGEFKCFRCKGAVFPELETLVLDRTGARLFARAACPDCGGLIGKLLDKTECDRLQNHIDTNTSLGPSDEGSAQGLVGVGKPSDQPAVSPGNNDRVLHAWQTYAGRYDPKTIAAHLAAIRQFERFVGSKDFRNVTAEDVNGWRGELVARAGKRKEDGGLSRSSVRHLASHLKAFMTWLIHQPGFKDLAGLTEYFALPRAIHAQNGCEKPRAYPSLSEAEEMLSGLPHGTLKDRRDRAIFAAAFATGFREQALISLRLHHVDIPKRQVFHDGETLRAKNGKSFIAKWFPQTEMFQRVFIEWIEELRGLGLTENEAVFPDASDLAQLGSEGLTQRANCVPMRSASAVDAVFGLACEGRPARYTPHSARHCLAQLGDRLCRTVEQRKAWSLNFGHENEGITWKHYGNVSAARKAEIFEEFEVVDSWQDDDMRLMLALHNHELDRGTPEFARARDLWDAYRTKSGGALG